MRTIESNGIKIYELSKGSVIPEYLTTRRQQQLKQKHKIMTTQLDVIHDLTMPDVSTNISVSPDEKFMFILGAYSPRVRCYELEQLSMKFERYCDELPSKIAYLDTDYSKFVVLEGERTLSFHSGGGIHKKVRCDNVVKELIYSTFKNQLFIPDSKGIITLMNIETSNISSKILDKSTPMSFNCAAYNGMTDLFLAGTSNGFIHGYDCRTAAKIATINVTRAPAQEYLKKSYIPEISKLAFKDPLKIGVGTDKGMFHLYDIRNNKRPFSSRDLDYAFPVRSIAFHEEKVIAAVKSVFKIWEPIEGDEGQIVATYDTNTPINDFFQFPGSGLFFAATNEPQIQTYFIPRIGDAPRWCQQLSNLIVDVEAESQSNYDTHTFVTREEIDELSLDHLIGTPSLRAYMHGFHVSNETYKRAMNAASAAKLAKAAKDAPVKAAYEEEEAEAASEGVAVQSLAGDERFAKMFTASELKVDPTCRAFNQVEMDKRQVEKKRKKKMALKAQAQKSRRIANNEEDDDVMGDSD